MKYKIINFRSVKKKLSARGSLALSRIDLTEFKPFLNDLKIYPLKVETLNSNV